MSMAITASHNKTTATPRRLVTFNYVWLQNYLDILKVSLHFYVQIMERI